MTIPETIKIGAHTYAISFRDDMDDTNFGVCRPNKLKIFIDGTVPQSQQEETFFHEVLHAIFSQIGLSMPDDMKEEERQVQSIAHSFYQVLKENNLLK